jgi:hypothetical protein
LDGRSRCPCAGRLALPCLDQAHKTARMNLGRGTIGQRRLKEQGQ